MSPKLKNLLIIPILLIVGYTSMAQDAVGGSSPPTPPSESSLPGLVVPIDENIAILLVAGLLAGIVYVCKRHLSKVSQ